MLYHTHPTLTVHTTQVRRCEVLPDGRFGVVLVDQLLYPEGGGQPSDHGWIAGVEVEGLRREGAEVVHLLARPVAGEVEVRLDAARRRDHREQHSGQHLLSAIAQDRFGLPTTAFHLGPDRSDIEVSGESPTAEGLAALQAAVNEAILLGAAVSVREVNPAAMEGLPVRTRGLPSGHTGPVRLVEIAGFDLNTCGGTHVADTRELRAFAIVGVERLGRSTRLHFLVGGRVVRALTWAVEREAALTAVLACAPGEHASAALRLTEEGRRLGKLGRALSAELATVLGSGLGPSAGLRLWHRDDGDLAFLNGVADAARVHSPDAVSVWTGEGVFLVTGPEAEVARFGPQVAALLGGRGGGARGKFQGKFSDPSLRSALRHLRWTPSG